MICPYCSSELKIDPEIEKTVCSTPWTLVSITGCCGQLVSLTPSIWYTAEIAEGRTVDDWGNKRQDPEAPINKIQFIKKLKDFSGAGLREAKEAAENSNFQWQEALKILNLAMKQKTP